MSVTEAEVRHMASLARIALRDERLLPLVAELNGILGHMDVLQQVKLPPHATTAEPASHIGPPSPLRTDSATPSAVIAALPHMAPEFRDGFFLVPRLSTHGDPDVASHDDVGQA